MGCIKCGYVDQKDTIIFGRQLCKICAGFSPQDKQLFQSYVEEKIDWKILDTFRKFGQIPGVKQKEGMNKKAELGNLMTRPPMGYDVQGGDLIPNKDFSRVHSLFKTFLNRNYSLNSLAKNFSLSVNGVKKILTNRTYLGEIKFDGKIHRGEHRVLISPEIFYAVQRKLKGYLRPRQANPHDARDAEH
jgi:hypothetical protein